MGGWVYGRRLTDEMVFRKMKECFLNHTQIHDCSRVERESGDKGLNVSFADPDPPSPSSNRTCDFSAYGFPKFFIMSVHSMSPVNTLMGQLIQTY